MPKPKAVTLLASFPPIQSAIKVAGNGDGMRIQLDIPESEVEKAEALLRWRGELLVVTIRPESGVSDAEGDAT
jgi:hypothetical protein